MYMDIDKKVHGFPYPVKQTTWNDVVIRIMDVFSAILALIIFAPIFLVVAILIKLEERKAPIIFKQERIGKGGRHFKMYKFRSMYVESEAHLNELIALNEVEGHMFKIKNDPRITKIGRIIRKLSIDEFPQLFNVLMGDMSMVGPRPPLKREYEHYTDHDKKRLVVKPGCTGLWQISGRNELSFAEMVNLDLKYIEKRGILVNIRIMLLTFKEITFFGKGM